MTVTIAEEPPRQESVLRLLALSDEYMTALYPPESNHLLDISSLEKPEVAFFVARHEGAVMGCVALVADGEGAAEIKRMFVDPAARGLGIGARLMERLETEGKARGFAAIRLETGISQPEAIGLYRKYGYEEIGPFGSYKLDPLSMFMEKRLA